uniref:Uncharacterized protein orf83 n=1 Tax=Heterostelium pallidum TaxID=13642 RepID=Q5ILJ2_HETPA|nr:hypothetical protein PopaoMp32 [Heterostelium pallidum]AAU00618.1 unknown [Heterostelium pallidum]
MNILKKIEIQEKKNENKVKIKRGRIIKIGLYDRKEPIIGIGLKNKKNKIGLKISKRRAKVIFYIPRRGHMIKEINVFWDKKKN